MRALIARAGALGDLLLLRRALAALRRGGHAVTLLAPAPGALLVGAGAAEVDAHLDWDAKDAATLLGGGRLPAGALREALARCDVALAYSRSVALAHGLARLVPLSLACDPQPPDDVHAAHWLARPLATIGLDVGSAPPERRPTSEDLDAARPWLERLGEGFLALHPGSGSRGKNWPFERFLELADRLARDEPWLLALGPAEAALAGATRAGQAALERAVVARDVPLRVLAALLSRAGRYVGNDSGVTHLAAACGAPTLALFGPSDPRVWAPDAPGAVALRAPTPALETLTLDAVERAARGLAVRLTSATRAPRAG